MDNRLSEKSYNKSKTVRKLLRDEMFERSRRSTTDSYLTHYDEYTQRVIKESLTGPVPTQLPEYNNITRDNISYFRRSQKFVYKTRINDDDPHDFHMTFESLWGLAGVENVQSYENYEKVIKDFQANLNQYLQMPEDIKEMAIIAAGNKVIGKEEDIMAISNEDRKQLYVLVNHVYERKIPFKAMYSFLGYGAPIIYRTIYQMSNNYKDEIIESIMDSPLVLEHIIDGMAGQKGQVKSLEVQLYCVRIVGNILAEREDYSQIFMKNSILEKIYCLLETVSSQKNSQSPSQKKIKLEIKKDVFWLLSNYICDSAPANSVLCKQNLLQKILISYRNENEVSIKTEIYYVLSYLASYGDSLKIYKLGVQEEWLAQCSSDIEIQSQELTLIVLNLIAKLVDIGQQYINQTEGDINPFTHYIVSSKLKTYIHAKTYNKNLEISNASFQIMDHVEEYLGKYGDMDS